MKNIPLSLSVVVMVLFFLSACSPQGEQIMIQTPQGSDYSNGYGDGCASGRRAAGIVDVNGTKDTLRYLQSSNYKSGWDTGYKECKFREEKVAKLPQERKQPMRF